MNFKEWLSQKWFDTKRRGNYAPVYAPIESKIAWEACKEEVLKILNRRNNGNINDLLEDRIKEIEKL
jgi:hypothetical protein